MQTQQPGITDSESGLSPDIRARRESDSPRPAPAGGIVPGQWRCCSLPPGKIADPSQLDTARAEWLSAAVPGTVASILAANDRWSFDNPPDIDSSDWWFQWSFPFDHPGQFAQLHLDGLATLAEVWLNGELLLATDNMFRRHCVDVSARLQRDNILVIGFRSLAEDLKRKRPRPRWKTNLVHHQQLRWHRTTLQGRIPGWSPPAPAIGPWRAVRLETGPVAVHDLVLHPRLEGTCGIVSVQARLQCSRPIRSALVRVGTHLESLQLQRDADGYSAQGTVRLHNATLWWPHTHGQPALYDCELVLDPGDGTDPVRLPCSPIGFRKLNVVQDGDFQVRVNDVPVYCRGACWTVSDSLTLTGTADQLRHDLTLLRDAGANMLRVGGTMVYESDAFYRLCDELGILVWQDFMFANMDYPVEDDAFRHNIEAEVGEQLVRLSCHPSVAVYCGNSEVEQQAAMLGMPRELWTNSWFSSRLPELCERLHPGTAYVPSTPTGGVLPFQPGVGLTHYYGVGAYLRPVSDVRRSDVRFTPECLGFSNVPEAATVDAIMQGTHTVTHSPRWKRRVPRDTGAGWDFEDVRDHYLKELFQVDPLQLRSRDMPKYLQVSRLVSGEMMQQAFAEWRSAHSHNGGALVWFYKDLWPAAGWGIVDSSGTPKSAYYALKRSWNPRQLAMTDEGLNGLHLHLVNETASDCDGVLEVMLLKEPDVIVARQEVAVRVDARSRRLVSADEVLGGFYDVSYAYRFGPPNHDVVVATWLDGGRQMIGEAFHFIRRCIPAPDRSVVLTTSGEVCGDGLHRVTVSSSRFLHAVHVAARGYLPDDNDFHLPPDRPRTVTFRARTPQPPPFKPSIEALNLDSRTL